MQLLVANHRDRDEALWITRRRGGGEPVVDRAQIGRSTAGEGSGKDTLKFPTPRREAGPCDGPDEINRLFLH